MSNSMPVMTEPNASGDVRVALSNSESLNLSLGGLTLPTTGGSTTAINSGSSNRSQNTSKVNGAPNNPAVGGPTLADILGSNATPPHVGSGNSSHPTVGSNATPIANDRSSCTLTGPNHTSGPANHSTHSPTHFGVMPQVSGGPELASGTTNSTTSSVQICQRMDEVSARMIAMEEVFNKLCCKITDQEATIQLLRQQSERFLTTILAEVRQVNQSIPILDNPEDNEKDGFVTDLLNSITNVSSNYLKKVNSNHTQKYKRQRTSFSESDGNLAKHDKTAYTADRPASPQKQQTNDKSTAKTPTTSQQFFAQQQHVFDNTQEANTSQIPLPNYLTQQSFTLNPNGIKRRRANTSTNNNTPTSISNHQDFTSLNGIGSMSMPNLALENMTRKFPPNINDNTNSSIMDNGQSSSKVRHRNIDIRVGSDRGVDTDSTDEEDGYQEDDEDHNSEGYSSQIGRRSHFRGNITRPHEINYHGAYADLLETGSHSLSRSSSHRPQREQPSNVYGRENNRYSYGMNEPRLSNSGSREKDLNYTLLKAPANVRAIWQEYTEGINGFPSVKFLEEAYGNKWRLKKNVKTFARRKRLYKFIVNGMKQGHSADEMIDILENRRIYNNEHGEVKKRTIGWLQQSLSGI
ncbi:LANO_0E03466g1_1 [Lachancea nothofagi CBS 11611]|uniref:LANO_0E03466g1_1 n=1 Tax=Lachancea nothofagi CBS 11611 TaxID=1266666 RepID=A0A1G4JR32_9SACH|nr:LANO_0E03466g1_1 [Lachancea nothofagi CBS 11611]